MTKKTNKQDKIQRTIYLDIDTYKFLEKESKRKHIDKVNTLISMIIREYVYLENLRKKENDSRNI